MITYENISMVKGKEPRSIWWRPDPDALRDARPLRFGLQKCGFNQQPGDVSTFEFVREQLISVHVGTALRILSQNIHFHARHVHNSDYCNLL